MKKIITSIMIILCFCFPLNAINNPFTQEEYDKASWFQILFTTRGQLKLTQVDFQDINKVKDGYSYVDKPKPVYSSIDANHFYIIFELKKDKELTNDQKEALLYNENNLTISEQGYIIISDVPLSREYTSLLTDAQKIALAMGATLVVIGGFAYYCYPEKVKSGANSVVSVGGTACSYIVYPFAWVWGKLAGR